MGRRRRTGNPTEYAGSLYDTVRRVSPALALSGPHGNRTVARPYAYERFLMGTVTKNRGLPPVPPGTDKRGRNVWRSRRAETFYDYRGGREHGAMPKTAVTKVGGELAAGQSRKTESFLAANDTVLVEQESVWDGDNWLLLSSGAHEYDEEGRGGRHGNALLLDLLRTGRACGTTRLPQRHDPGQHL